MADSPSGRAGRGDRGLTTRGRCLFAGGVAAIVCALLLDERDLLRVGILAAALPLVAMMLTMSRRTQFTAMHQALPDRLRPGTTGSVRLLLTNTGALRTRPLEVVEPATTDLTAGVRCLLPPLKPGATAVVGYPLVAARRGRFLIGPPRVRVSDPFGLWEDNRIIPSRTEVMVVPRVVALTGMPSSVGARSAASGEAVAGTSGGDPDVGIRHYNPGDDIRTIHWRASARHDELMVRLEEPVSHGGTTVLLDHRAAAHRGIGPASSLEVAVSLAASVSLHLLDGDYQVRLVSHTGAVIATGNDIADDVLAGLADVEADVVGDLQPAAVRAAGLVVAVLGDLDPAAAHLLVASRTRSSRGVALLLATDEWDPARGPAHPAAATAAVLTAGGWRVVVIHPGDDLAAAWRLACRAEAFHAGRRVS
ncbi:MAG TPA: DUF58 domain-containing protein [Nakamurella sp.]|nr:DUF58 domain-containing protein [Nakamurella sp.]